MSERQERSRFILSCIFFATTSFFGLQKVKRDKEKKLKHGRTKLNFDDMSIDDGKIAERCKQALHPPMSYLEAFFKSLEYPFQNPERLDGYIPFCVAENKLVTEMLAERLMQSAAQAFSDPMVYAYNNFSGIPIMRQSLAYFIAKRFLYPNVPSLTTDQALSSINPNHVGIGSGAAGILNALFFLLGDEGDACLIPAPYYAAFDNDMSLIANIVPFAFTVANPTIGPTESELDLAFIQAKSEGLNPKFMLITNPNNPLGVIYEGDIIRNAIQWARKRKLHTIMDEIYALSGHMRNGLNFQSVVRILENNLGDDVHMVWSLSKDFGSSGLRLGMVYSQNELFLRGLANFNIFSGVSNPMQMLISELLTDDQFVDLYLDESRHRLRQSYQICVQKLEEMVLPFVHAEAAMFVYVDFSSLLPVKTMEWEAKLSQLFVDHARLILTPGESMRERMPGMFRICYAWVEPEVLRVGMERLSRIVAKIRRLDWGDLNEKTLKGVL